MVKLLHLSDVHLDTLFAGRSEDLRRRLRGALREAFARAIRFAIDEEVNAVLIAGDLFDGDRLSLQTEIELCNELTELGRAGIQCFYAPGNHDPAGRGRRTSRIEWPDNVHVFDSREPRTVDLQDAQGEVLARVTGAAHVTDREGGNIAATFPAVSTRVPSIALLHAAVVSARGIESHDRYAPCSVEDFAGRGYSYWALGHVHESQCVCEASHAWYAGNLQGRTPRELGPRGGLLVSIDDSAPAVAFQPFAPVEWMNVSVDDLSEIETASALERHLIERLEREASDAAADLIVRVHLSGATPLFEELSDSEQIELLEEHLIDRLSALDVEIRTSRLVLPADLGRLRAETTPLATVLQLIDSAGADDELLRELVPEDLALELHDDESLPYMRSLLEDLDAEAAHRLLDRS